jgi:hypothetical protein
MAAPPRPVNCYDKYFILVAVRRACCAVEIWTELCSHHKKQTHWEMLKGASDRISSTVSNLRECNALDERNLALTESLLQSLALSFGRHAVLCVSRTWELHNRRRSSSGDQRESEVHSEAITFTSKRTSLSHVWSHHGISFSGGIKLITQSPVARTRVTEEFFTHPKKRENN